MANLKSLPIKGATFFIFEARLSEENELSNTLFIGLNLADAPSDQIWISKKIEVGQSFDSSTLEGNKAVYGRIKEMKSVGRINLVDDFDVKGTFEDAGAKLVLRKKISWSNI